PTTAQKLTTSSLYQQVTKTSQGPTQRAKRSLAAWQEQVPKTDEGGMQNRCATRKELELQSFQRWIASSCPGGRGWVYHGELRCHSRLASQNRSTTKSSYGRISLLHRIYKESQHHRVRQRAHCLLLSYQGIHTTALMAIFSVDRITIYNWFDAWEAHHCAGLYDKKRCGRPPKLTDKERKKAQYYLEQHPRDIKQVVYL